MTQYNAPLLEYLVEELKLDLTRAPLQTLLHKFVYDTCRKDRDSLHLDEPFEQFEKAIEITKLLVKNEALLRMQEIGYGNTLLHIAVSLHSPKMVKLLARKDLLEIKNLAEMTALDAAVAERTRQEGEVNPDISARNLAPINEIIAYL